jgi:ferritin
MLKKSLEDALNKQINEEFFSHYLYLSMSAYLVSENLAGFANWMKIQSQEEYFHFLKFYDYVLQAGGKVTLQPVKEPKITWKNIHEIFKDTVDHEIFITNCINDIATLAVNEKDHATMSFLKWFIDEQVEEVATAEQILRDVKMVGDNTSALFLIDRELKGRVPAMTFTIGGAKV